MPCAAATAATAAVCALCNPPHVTCVWGGPLACHFLKRHHPDPLAPIAYHICVHSFPVWHQCIELAEFVALDIRVHQVVIDDGQWIGHMVDHAHLGLFGLMSTNALRHC